MRPRQLQIVAAGLLTALLPTFASAAGYDTPMLYTARHMGMGGAAIGYVDDPSAVFHNPAGLASINGGAVIGDFSPLGGKIHGSPSNHTMIVSGKSSQPGLDIDSETTFAPFFLVGAGYKLHKYLTLGFAAYPVASAGATYKYETNVGKDKVGIVEDSTKLVFLEFAPSLAVQLLDNLQIGVAYRYSTVDFQRNRINPDSSGTPSNIKLDMTGSNAKGFRAGIQYKLPTLQVGLVYRNETDTSVSTDSGILTNINAKDITYGFKLPQKIGVGVQYTGVPKLRLALDGEYTWQSANTRTGMSGTMAGLNVPVGPIYNVMNWQDNITVRVGGGYQLGKVEARAGYTFDAQASQTKFPSPFGTPPAATHVATLGAGYRINDALDVSIAGAYRTGKATVTASDVANNQCPFCGFQGTSEVNLFGGYVDVVWRFGGKQTTGAAEPTVAKSEPVATAKL